MTPFTPPLRRLLTAAAATGALLVTLPAPSAGAVDSTQCTFPSEKYPGRPWSLQRVLMDELWKQSTGKGVRVAVIDTGVDDTHPDLAPNFDRKASVNCVTGKP
uniref:S8 family serine peptidase n=1 Tax=Streptomyces sp. DSM 41540 TaxID=3448657 RepID=UPI0040400E9A